MPVSDFIRGIRNEIRARSLDDVNPEIKSLYLGGGTPSRLGAEGIQSVIDVVRESFPLADGAELTIEANPEDVSDSVVQVWKRAGVNRVSLGVQSFNDRVLKWMHRVHDSDMAARAVNAIQDSGISNISIDLIFAVPESLGRDWKEDTEKALMLSPNHVSLYGLTVEPTAPLGKWVNRGIVREADESTYENDYLHAHEYFRAAGFDHYEVSNFGLPGYWSLHNSSYWKGVPYLGLGPSAHGFDGEVRRWNEPVWRAWQKLVDQGIDPKGGSEMLTQENLIAEQVYLGLRTESGLDIHASEVDLIGRWEASGWVKRGHDGRIRCTVEGWLRLDALAAALTASRSC